MENNISFIKSNKGITLAGLAAYMIVILIVLGILTTISTFFYDNLGIIQENARYAAQFDKFNSNFVSDVKKNKDVSIDAENKTITFEDGTKYIYNSKDNGIYREQVKIATNVTYFYASKKVITINNVEKSIVTVEIIIGESSKTLFTKKIDYTLKYW